MIIVTCVEIRAREAEASISLSALQTHTYTYTRVYKTRVKEGGRSIEKPLSLFFSLFVPRFQKLRFLLKLPRRLYY